MLEAVPLAAKVQCASAGKDYCEEVPKRRVLKEVNAKASVKKYQNASSKSIIF